MSNQHRGAEWKVGLFIAIGIAIIAVMAVVFGKLGTGLQSFYDVTAEFPDARHMEHESPPRYDEAGFLRATIVRWSDQQPSFDAGAV